MRPNTILIVALFIVSAGVLAAGCVTPGENVTQPTAPPTGTPIVTETTATPVETPTATETTAVVTETATETMATATTTPTATETTPTATETPTTAPSAATVDLSARDTAFNTNTITVPAGADVTVNFDNEDDDIPHNFAVYTDSSASQSIFVGDTITGPDTTTYTFTAPSDPGTYFFRCDVHPQQMNGDFIVQ
ncbi:MAG: hypothetical protein GX882_06870 [Methanomicrobiales archaeon]|nr:hypothetical protein [Methanomicrobiales archaeon]